MSRGIIIYGASGSGKTTLGKALAQRLALQHIDIDDYIWRWDTQMPYTVLRPRQERIACLEKAISTARPFVMTGSMWSIRASFNARFDLAVFLTVPTAIRMERLRAREAAMFGARILPGGDMYEQNRAFLDDAAAYDTGEPPQVCQKQHEQWTAELSCPVLRVDGTKDIAENAAWIAEQFLLLAQ
ncbi:MAG: AAA family ATPase [Eubacteriales bacterium]|nr:AAA family ATPase [Eubacteriales bacterium]